MNFAASPFIPTQLVRADDFWMPMGAGLGHSWKKPLFTVSALPFASFATFFERDASGEELPRHRVSGLADYFQRRYEVTAGNWIDQGHATELLYADLVFTRDATLHKVLQDIVRVVPGLGRPVLLESTASIADQLRALQT